MNSYISNHLSKWLEKEGAIRTEDQNLFTFAMISFLFGLFPIVISAILGLIFDLLLESLLMILPYMLIRKFSGGFHFKSAYICFIVSTLLLVIALTLVNGLLTAVNIQNFSLLVLLSILSLCVNSPIASLARTLSAQEIKIFRLATISLCAFSLLVYAWFYHSHLSRFYIPIGMGIMLTAFLQFPCVIENLFLKSGNRTLYKQPKL